MTCAPSESVDVYLRLATSEQNSANYGIYARPGHAAHGAAQGSAGHAAHGSADRAKTHAEHGCAAPAATSTPRPRG